MTSTLQQEAGRKLRLSSQQTMRVAQRLYENGYITYMRHRLDDAVGVGARRGARPGPRACTAPTSVPGRAAPVQPQGQERPGGARGDPAGGRQLPDARRGARRAHGRRVQLYELIWKRTVASQMADARGQTVSVRIAGDALPTARSRRVRDRRHGDHLPRLPARLRGGPRRAVGRRRGAGCCRRSHEGDALTQRRSSRTATRPRRRARYTEASLVKALEERGIGRPSTYAAIMGTILDRGYVRKQGQALVPEFLAFAVVNLLESHFPQLVDYEFTARMEDDLDEIASGDEARTDVAAALLLRRRRRRRAEGARRRTARRDRRSRDQHGRAPWHRHRRARRQVRPVPRARRRAADAAARHRPRRADARARRGDPRAGEPGARARRRPRDRPHDRRPRRPLRPVRHRACSRATRSRARRRSSSRCRPRR